MTNSNSNVLIFANQNLTQSETGLLKTIETVVEKKLKSLTARARLACQTLTSVEAGGLEKQALENFIGSQSLATTAINNAIYKTNFKSFQAIAVQIAVLIAAGNFESAIKLFNETIAVFSQLIAKIVELDTAIDDRIQLAA